MAEIIYYHVATNELFLLTIDKNMQIVLEFRKYAVGRKAFKLRGKVFGRDIAAWLANECEFLGVL